MPLMQILIPFLIFLARVSDVTIGTIRIIVVSRGVRLLAAFLGFFEVMIWPIAIRQIMQNLDNVFNYIAYAAGFATGNYVGVSVERKLTVGNLMVRVAVKEDASDIIASLRSAGYGVTTVDAQGVKGSIKIVFTVIKKKNLDKVLAIVKKYTPQAFYTVEDVRFVTEQHLFPVKDSTKNLFWHLNAIFQKRK